jgi:NADH-quinone oxidoreductase subunit A
MAASGAFGTPGGGTAGGGRVVIETYAPLIPYGAILVVIAAGMLAASVLIPRALGTGKPTPVKQEPYECGVPPLAEGARGRFSVRFYLVAILFILFDIETVFLIPWAIEYRGLGVGAFVEVLVFIGTLIIAYLYVWKRRALEWE